MNKTVKVDSRREQLEAELIGDQLQDEQSTGQFQVHENNGFDRAAARRNKMFEIRQGIHRRHPSRVLHQFEGVVNTTSSASTLWEQALLHDTKRASLPQDFRPKNDVNGMANQMGVVTTALENYRNSRGKLERMHLVGV